MSTNEDINDELARNALSNLQKENKTLSAMVENRNSELQNKEKAREALNRLIADVQQQREEIEKNNTNITYLSEQLQKTNLAYNELLQTLKQKVSTDAEGETMGDPKITMLSQLLNSPLGEKLLDRLLPSQTQVIQSSPLPGITQDMIQQRMAKSITSTWDVGEALIDSLQTKIINKAITQKVSEVISNDHED